MIAWATQRVTTSASVTLRRALLGMHALADVHAGRLGA